MGKNQHSKDLLHIRPTEWAQDHGGFKDRKRSPFAKLPLHCCFLSLQPFEKPVGTRDGAVFDVLNIVPYIKKYRVHPVSGDRLEISELIPLHFHRTSEEKLQCPVTFKEFTNHSKVVMNAVSGHVYSAEAIEQLNKKVNNWKDLITSQPFTKADIITIQDPDDLMAREVSKFYFMAMGQQDVVTNSITNRAAIKDRDKPKEQIRRTPAMERIYDEKRRLQEEKEKDTERAEAAAASESTPSASSSGPVRQRQINERYTSGEVAESFTSTATPLRVKNELRLMTDEEDLQEIYGIVRKNKAKGYVRLITSEGMLNIELHANMVPRTTDNFLRLCEKGYLANTVFHRLVRNFCIQGGDPTGTGKGGESAFEGGKAFNDEFDSRLTHQGPGIVSMANSGKNTNKSQFFVSLKSCTHLDGKHSIFGRVVGGLQLLTVFNNWEVGEKDKPKKEISILRTEVFKNPFKDAIIEAAKPKVEKVVNPSATWFSNRKDPMEAHKNRHSAEVGKYLEVAPLPPLPGEKRKALEELPPEEMEYVSVPQRSKRARTAFDFAAI